MRQRSGGLDSALDGSFTVPSAPSRVRIVSFGPDAVPFRPWIMGAGSRWRRSALGGGVPASGDGVPALGNSLRQLTFQGDRSAQGRLR
jgi:hypothetical protein